MDATTAEHATTIAMRPAMAAADAALGVASKVGPYFTVVSFIPAAIFTLTTTFLVAAQPWTGSPDFALALKQFATPSLGQIGALLVAITVLALSLHPLQVSIVQLLEGYWGTGSVSLGLARAHIRRHLRRLRDLEALRDESLDEIEDLSPDVRGKETVVVPLRWRVVEANRLLASFPDPEEVRPTRLGNALRKFESQAGQPYGLDIVVTAPHLLLVGEPGDVAYVRDQRTQLDLASRLCAMFLLLAITFCLLLAPCGWWLLLALAPYLLALLFYRGACLVAMEYGTSLQALMDLNRPKFYERMGVRQPSSSTEEREQNEKLSQLLVQRIPVALNLRPPSSPAR